MTALSNHGETQLLKWQLTGEAVTRPSAWYIGVGTGSSDAGLVGEPSDNGYARQAITFSVTDNLGTNTNPIGIGPCSGTNWGTMSHFGIFDSLSGGNMLWHGTLQTAKLIEVGDSLVIAPGDIDLTLD